MRFKEVVGFISCSSSAPSYDLGVPCIEVRHGPSVWGDRSWRDVECFFGPNARRTSIGTAYRYGVRKEALPPLPDNQDAMSAVKG